MTNDIIPVSFPPIYGERIDHLYPNVRITIERITPEVAEKMLKTNIGNRDPKREPLEKAIRNDEWVLNGATIIFDMAGNLIDGQNRLMACIRSGKPIDTIVVRGISRSAQITMDTGVKRVLADYLKMAGYPNYNALAAVGLAIYRVDTYGLSGAFSLPNTSKDTVKAVFEFIQAEYAERLKPLVGLSKAIHGQFRGIQGGTTAALFDTFKAAGTENTYEFIQQLLNKKPACVSVRLLQDRLYKNAESKQGRMPQRMVAALIIKAWNAYMRGDDIKQLKFTQGGANPESFPEVFLGYE